MTTLPNQPFPLQTVCLNTLFYHSRIVFHIKDLPNELRPYPVAPTSSGFHFILIRYLALFQELLFETDLKLSPTKHIPYTDVVKSLSNELVGVECGVGFGSSTFSCDMLPEIFYIYGVSLSKRKTWSGVPGALSLISPDLRNQQIRNFMQMGQ